MFDGVDVRVTVSVAVPDFVVSFCEVAVTVTWAGLGTYPAAVYSPVLEINAPGDRGVGRLRDRCGQLQRFPDHHVDASRRNRDAYDFAGCATLATCSEDHQQRN